MGILTRCIVKVNRNSSVRAIRNTALNFKKSINMVDKVKCECYLNIRKMLALKINEC